MKRKHSALAQLSIAAGASVLLLAGPALVAVSLGLALVLIGACAFVEFIRYGD